MLFDDLEKNVFHENEPKSGITGWEEATASLGPETKVRLAGMLPGLARWCHSAVEGLPNELVDVCSTFLTLRVLVLMIRCVTL